MSGGADNPAEQARRVRSDRHTRVTVVVALVANLGIAVAKAVGGFVAGSPSLLSEAAHSVADCLNEIFLLTALRRSRRPPDRWHPFGYGKERWFWSLLAAIGIFVMGGCFSFFQAVEALRSTETVSVPRYLTGIAVLVVALLAEGGSLLRALHQARQQGGTAPDPAHRTVIAEDGAAVVGVVLAMTGMGLHLATGNPVWEAAASLTIGLLLVYVAYRLARESRDQLIGAAIDPEPRTAIRRMLDGQPEIDNVAQLLTMRLGPDSALVAARIDLVPGLDSEEVETVSERIKKALSDRWPQADQVFLDITEAPPRPGR
ncbi:cation diffusion facilitator family transporter [Streptomyces sp. MBT53]|uniref:cation diffusion facilitator family transporter n=1 Tax=Streptomyces sp. MBT53 TaxID=1488384 RepID=UPI001913613B|nr:cation diffusion facilitator family transporter [Streptomyces sp. MBT53]MBK6014034.1 cation diffusion facilitator family transporter [Streptomyces sp. MBT53]